MSPKNTRSKLHKLRKGKVREDAKEQGYYDGRFHTRIVPDKKKKQDKEKARKYGKEINETQEN
jgi:hypothetical protein